MLEDDVAMHVGFACAGSVLLFLGIHDVGEPLQRHAGLGHLRQHAAESSDREAQHAIVGDEGDVFSRGHAAFDRKHSPEACHQQDLQAAEDVLDGEEAAHDVRHVHPKIRVDLIGLLEALALSGVCREGPHDAHARQVFLYGGGDFALLLVALHKPFFHLFAEEDGIRQDEGDRRHGDGSHRCVHREHEGDAHRHEDGDAQHGS